MLQQVHRSTLRLRASIAGSFSRTAAHSANCFGAAGAARLPSTAAPFSTTPHSLFPSHPSSSPSPPSSQKSRNEVLYGTTEPPLPPPLELTAGDVTVALCAGGGGVLSIDFGGDEVCRGISFVHRDGGWGQCKCATLVGLHYCSSTLMD